MDDRKIFECIAKKQPGVRAVQISDLLDVPLSEVSEALRELVESGELVRSAGFAPNGTPAQLYDFSAAFKDTNDYKAVMAAAAPAAGAVAASATTPAPTHSREAESELSLAERMVRHILRTGGATDDELRAMLALKYTIYPSGYLSTAMKNGRITKRGNKWIPADGRAPVVAPAPATSVDVPKFLAGHVPTPAENKPNGGAGKPRRVVAEPTPTPAPVVEAAPAPELRCGVWSDGVVELQRNGKPVAVLMQNEFDFMSAFIQRLRAAA